VQFARSELKAPHTGRKLVSAVTTPSRIVIGDWVEDAAGNVGRTAVYDRSTGKLIIGGLRNHSAVLREAGYVEKSAKELSGLVLVKKGGVIYFDDFSGFFPRKLTTHEQAAIRAALEAEFGLPAVYGKVLGIRPGAPR
jgi:hypothetical protein